MNSQPESSEIQRYVALDIHKEYVMLGAMNSSQEWVIRPRRVEMIHFRSWATKNLRPGDAVAIETTTNVWTFTTLSRRWSLARWLPTPGLFAKSPKRE